MPTLVRSDARFTLRIRCRRFCTRLVRSGRAYRPASVQALLEDLGGVADSFVCGPDGFVEVASALLMQAGQPGHAIRTERSGQLERSAAAAPRSGAGFDVTASGAAALRAGQTMKTIPRSNGRLGLWRASCRTSLYMPTNADEVWAALAWGAVPSVGLLVGAIAGAFSRMPHQPIAMAMSVGAGLLLAGVSLKVAADAIQIAGAMAAALSLLLGAAVFSASNALLARFGAAHRKRCGECIQQPAESQQPGSGVAIAIGNALDAAPEAMVLGIALRDPVVPLALVIAFSVGNLPVALSSTVGMRAAGRRYAYIFLLWSAIAIGAAVAIVAGYVGFGSLSQAWPPRLQAFGAGALLAMAAETMIPEAFHNSPRFSGLLAAFGFGLLLLVDATTR